MNQVTYRIATNSERKILAQRSGRLLLALAEKLTDTEPLATYIQKSSFVNDILEGRFELPIHRLQWLRGVEAEIGEINWYHPSLLLELAVAFESHITGPLSSETEIILKELELKFAKQEVA